MIDVNSPPATTNKTGGAAGSMRRQMAHGVPIGTVLAGSIILVFALVWRFGDPVRGTQPGPSSVAAAKPASNAVVQLDAIPLPGAVYDLTYDQARDAIWFAFMSADQPDGLYKMDLKSKGLSSWPLPPTTHNGFLERVAVAPDGSIWVTEEYSVIRLDPATGAMASRTFDLADPDATTTALAQDDPSPGTWPSAITFDPKGRALVARHNVHSLLQVDSSLAVVSRINLPTELKGPGDLVAVGNTIYAAPYSGGGRTFALAETGRVIGSRDQGSVRLVPVGGKVLSVGLGGVLTFDAGLANSTPTGINGGSPLDRGAGFSNGDLVVYLDSTAVVERLSAAGELRTSIDLTQPQIQVLSPLGSPVTVTPRHEVGGLVVDGQGTVWYVDNTAHTLINVSL